MFNIGPILYYWNKLSKINSNIIANDYNVIYIKMFKVMFF